MHGKWPNHTLLKTRQLDVHIYRGAVDSTSLSVCTDLKILGVTNNGLGIYSVSPGPSGPDDESLHFMTCDDWDRSKQRWDLGKGPEDYTHYGLSTLSDGW